MIKAVLLITSLALGGCEAMSQAFYANAVEDYNDGRRIVRDYISDNIDARRAIRDGCLASMESRAAKLEQAGKWQEANTLRAAAYPPVITAKMIEDGDLSSLNTAHVCAATGETYGDDPKPGT